MKNEGDPTSDKTKESAARKKGWSGRISVNANKKKFEMVFAVIKVIVQTTEMTDKEREQIMPMLYIITILLFGLTGCAVQAQADPVKHEQELAKSNVWHKAKLRGVAFRAIGQEPGWLLEIKNGEEILVVTNYGQDRKVFPYVDPQEDKSARKTVFQIDANTRVLIEGKPCNDSMSGEAFDVTVTVTLGEQVFKGCGHALF